MRFVCYSVFCSHRFKSFAHPVTFKDGLAVTSIHRPKMTMSQVNYTIHRNVAVATSYVRMENPTGDLNMPALHANILLKRWNAIGSQGNLYGLIGAGVDTTSLASSQWTDEIRGFVGLQADYETQKIYTAANIIGFPSVNDMNDIPYMARYRFGIAPYIAHYDEFQIGWWDKLNTCPRCKTPLSLLQCLDIFIGLFYGRLVFP